MLAVPAHLEICLPGLMMAYESTSCVAHQRNMASAGADNVQLWLSSTKSGREGRVDSHPARGLPHWACRAQHNYLDTDYLALEHMFAMAQQLQP